MRHNVGKLENNPTTTKYLVFRWLLGTQFICINPIETLLLFPVCVLFVREKRWSSEDINANFVFQFEIVKLKFYSECKIQ